MRAFTASQLLSLWEHGLAQPAWQRALSLLAASLPDFTAEDLAKLPVGQRDACLLDLRERVFGHRLRSLATCPACGERLELSFDITDIRIESAAGPDEGQMRGPDDRLSLAMDGYEATFRPPNSLDLAAIAGMRSPEQARLHLLERCVLSAEENGKVCEVADLPEPITAAIAERIASSDPQGDVQISLSCPACAHEWQAAFDILTFFWVEINAWAQRILREVHLLARAYGWREEDILALSPWRRQAYLQMVTG